MFKQIFENKIGEKLNTFNNSGKAAFEWVDKFRQSLDISEKIEKIQQLNTNLLSQSDSGTPQISPISTENSKSESNYFYEKVTNPANSNAKGRRLSTGHGPEIEHSVTNFTETNDNSSALVASASYRQSFKGKKQSTINCSGSGHLQSPNFQINKSTDSGGSTNDFSLSSSSSISQKSTEFNTNANHTHLHQSNSINEETVVNYESRKTNSSKTLIRQSTDLTSSFPLKSFQKINSQTVEIPGLNVKVVRYRIENDLGKIEPHLYTKYSSAGIETNQVISKGKIYLTLRYNEEIRSFSVTVNKVDIYPNAKGNFMPNNFNSLHVSSNSRSQPNSPNLSKPDTYVKIVLLPDKKKKYQTKIQRKTMQPVFEETFYFQLPYEELNSKTLHLTLLEFGRFSRHELIGSVRISDLNLIKNLQASDVEIVKNILPLAEDDLELGELTMTLCYLPAAGRLTVTIVKAFNLKSMDINGKSDPYVKVTLFSKAKRVKKKKTSVMKNTLNPIYNESMLFDIPHDQIDQIDMIVKVIDYDRVGSNELIGCVGIGPSFNGIGRDHWFRMLENPRKPVTQTYFLRDNSFLKEGLPAKIEKALQTTRQTSQDSRGSDF